MTLESTINKNRYIGNGANKTFAFTFKIWKKDQILVFVGNGKTERNVTNRVSVNITATGGSVVFVDAPKSGEIVVIRRNMPFIQEDDYINGTRFNANEVEDRFDMDCAERQDLKLDISRSVKLPETSNMSADDLVADLMQARDDVIFALTQAGDVTGATRVVASGTTAARALQDRFSDWVNIKDFGAVGDGLTNDSTAFQTAVSTVPSGTHIFIPDGTYLVSNVEISKELYFHGPAKIKPRQNYFDNSTLQYTIAKYKNIFYFHDVEGCGLFDLVIVGDYDESWGYINAYNESSSGDSHTGSNLVVFLRCENVEINSLRFIHNIITLHNHDDFYARMTSTVGFTPLVVSFCDNVYVTGLRLLWNMCEEVVFFRSTNIKFYNCEGLSRYGHSQYGFEYCSSVHVSGCKFAITGNYRENSVVNFHSRDVLVDGCYFYGGNNVDVGNESVFYWANYGHDSDLDFTSTYLVKNVRFSGCYFDNVGFLTQFLVTAETASEQILSRTFLDEFVVDGCYFNIHLDDIPEYSAASRSTSYVRPVWWQGAHHGAIGNVVFSNNTINISGTLRSDRDLNDFRVFILSGTHDNGKLKILNNCIKSNFSTEPSNYELTQRDGWLYIGSNWKEVHVNKNDIYYPMGVTVSSLTMSSENHPFFNIFDFSGNHITGFFGVKFRTYRGFKTLKVCDNFFTEYIHSQTLYQHEDLNGVNTFVLLKPITAQLGYVEVKNNVCECAKVIHVPDSYDGLNVDDIVFKIVFADISGNTLKLIANTQTNPSNRRGIVVKNIGNTTGTTCKIENNFIAGNSDSERSRVYNFDKVYINGNLFSVGGLQTECSYTGAYQFVKNNAFISGASYSISENYTATDSDLT